NLMTVAAICAGLSAIRFAIHGHYELAVQLILVASVLDGLDGRLARMLKSESAIGAELDSLADFLNFGVAPGLLIYLWGFGEFQNQGWVAVVIYAVCCVMRLARFNVGNKSEISDTPKRFFTGVPAPAGAFLALLPLFAAFALHRPLIWPPEVIAVY
ncbi:phosphatidylcholine/phosphatidylserine synthase, partial [Thioclava sp. BHET1]